MKNKTDLILLYKKNKFFFDDVFKNYYKQRYLHFKQRFGLSEEETNIIEKI